MGATIDVEEQLDFLKAICTKPKDDNPRLAYADWLGRHGDEARAEFIRIQIERDLRPVGWGLCGPGSTHSGRCLSDDETRAKCNAYGHVGDILRDREHELLRAHDAAWRGPGVLGAQRARDMARDFQHRVWFSRGFITQVELPWEAWSGSTCDGCYDNDEPIRGAGFGNWRRSECQSCHGTGRRDSAARESAWSAGQLFWCRQCYGTGRILKNPIDTLVVACAHCNGEGAVKAPLPGVDVHPIATVTLTTRPNLLTAAVGDSTQYALAGGPYRWFSVCDKAWMHEDEILRTLLTQEWPEITFTFPSR